MHPTTTLRRMFGALLGAALTFSLASVAQAQPTIMISDGTNTVTVVDDGPNDSFLSPGVVQYSGSIGAWSLTVTTAFTKPLSGTAQAPSMDLNTVVNSTGPGTLTIQFTDDGFGPTDGVATIANGGTLAAGGTLTYSAYVSATNTEFSGTPLMAPLVANSNPYGLSTTANITQAGSYALTQVVTVVHTAAGRSTADATIAVPQPPPPVGTGAIGDFVWNDLNHNGIQDAGEPGIDGVKVTLTDSSNNVVGTTTTASNGYYQFTGLTAGTYTVTVDSTSTALTGLLPTVIAAPGSTTANDSNPNPATVTLATDSSTDETIDFGYYLYVPPTGKIGDFVWLDLNQNGIQDAGEPGINGVKVTLKDNGGNVIATQTTSGNGAYLFTGLPAGTYTVCIDTSSPALAGYLPTVANAPGSSTANDSNLNPATVVLATNSSSDLTIDFGFIPAPNGSIGDFVWKDLNGDGDQDAGEPGIPGVTVKLYQGTTLLATTVTDLDGYYLFTKLAAGTYTVVVDTTSPALANLTPTTVNAPGTTTANDSNPNPATVTLPLNTSSDTTIDFGFVPNPTGQIGNFVWRDLNHNGIQDAGEPGINNVTVTLKDSYGNLIATTVTSGNGGYLFTGLRAGNYIVQVDGTDSDLAGLIPTTVAAAGSNSANDSNPNPAPVTLATDSSVDLTIDFGFWAPGCGCIGDYVWYDCDGDGVQDANEAGIKGVTVKLYYGSFLLATQVTDAYGHYLFTGLPAGTFTVVIDNTQSALAGFIPTKVGGTTNKAQDSNPNPATVTLATSKSSDLTIDFGYTRTCPPCPITTCSPGNWCNKTNYFCKGFSDNFCKLYPCGLTIGAGRCVKFNTCQAVCSFLPCYGSGNYFQQSYCNPTTQIGCFAGNVVCLRVAVDCSKAGITGVGLGNCKFKSGKFCGWTVTQLLSQCEACLSGSRLPAGCSYQDLSDACNLVNCNFDLGKNCGYLTTN